MVENLLSAAPDGTLASFYRTSVGTEIDLVFELPGRCGAWVIEVKRGLTARPRKGFHYAHDDLKPDRALLVHSGEERYPVTQDIEAMSLHELAALLAGPSSGGGAAGDGMARRACYAAMTF